MSPADNPQLTDLNPAITVEDKKLVADQSAALVVVSGAFSPGREEVINKHYTVMSIVAYTCKEYSTIFVTEENIFFKI